MNGTIRVPARPLLVRTGMPTRMILALFLMISLSRVSTAEPVSLAPVESYATFEDCAFHESIDILKLIKDTQGLRASRQLRAAADEVRAECVDRQGLADRDHLDAEAVTRLIDETLVRALKYVYMSVDS